MPKLPAVIYVRKDEFLLAFASIDELDDGDKIGVYRIVETATITKKTQMTCIGTLTKRDKR